MSTCALPHQQQQHHLTATALLAKATELLRQFRLAARRKNMADTAGCGQDSGGNGGDGGEVGGGAPNDGFGEGSGGGVGGGGEGGGETSEAPNNSDSADHGGEGGAGGADAADASAVSDESQARRRHAIYEIVDSEESFVNKLRYIYEKYIPLKDDPEAGVPADLGEKWSIVWGNWGRLLEGHEDILAKLKAAFETDMDSVAAVFIAKERHLTSWYSKYCENHRKAQHIACEQYRDFFEQVRLNLHDKEDMNSHLMSPVQRCMRYSLLVGTVIEKARKDGLDGAPMADWEKMREIMRELPLKTESIMEASRIDNLEAGIRVTALGQVRIKGVLKLCALPGPYNSATNPPPAQLKFEPRKIFLFDQMMLVTEIKAGKAAKSKDQFSGLQTIYIYRSKVKMNNMRYFSTYKFTSPTGEETDDSGGGGQLFCVVDTTPGGNFVYVFDPVETETRAQWVAELRQMEKQQMDFLKILQNPVMMAGGGGSTGAGSGGSAGGSGDAAAGGCGASGSNDSSRKSFKDSKEKGSKVEGRKKGKLSFISRSRKSTRAPDGPLLRPQSTLERKNSCPDASDTASSADPCSPSPEASAASSSAHHHRTAAGKELRKVPSEVGSSGSYDTEPSQQPSGGVPPATIAKKKSGINFNSLQSFFANRKSKSRSESKLNPT